MDFKGRSAKRLIATRTENLKKAWAVQRESKRAREKAELKALKKEKSMTEKKERPLPMTKEERAEWAKNLLSGMGIDRAYVEKYVKDMPHIPSSSLVETIYGYKRVKETL